MKSKKSLAGPVFNKQSGDKNSGSEKQSMTEPPGATKKKQAFSWNANDVGCA